MSKLESALKLLGRLVGTWSTEATHPAVPGVIVRATIVGVHQLREDDVHWKDDLKITYRRQT